jgi:hypothetical protein
VRIFQRSYFSYLSSIIGMQQSVCEKEAIFAKRNGSLMPVSSKRRVCVYMSQDVSAKAECIRRVDLSEPDQGPVAQCEATTNEAYG